MVIINIILNSIQTNIILYSKTNNLSYIEQQKLWIKQIDSRFIFETILHMYALKKISIYY